MFILICVCVVAVALLLCVSALLCTPGSDSEDNGADDGLDDCRPSEDAEKDD